jgi:hypothetical protein
MCSKELDVSPSNVCSTVCLSYEVRQDLSRNATPRVRGAVLGLWVDGKKSTPRRSELCPPARYMCVCVCVCVCRGGGGG